MYLNNGICPTDEGEYVRRTTLETACYRSLLWLDAQDDPPITTLEEAWDRCPYPEWMTWAVARLDPSEDDLKRSLKAYHVIYDKLSKSPRDLTFFSCTKDRLDGSHECLLAASEIASTLDPSYNPITLESEPDFNSYYYYRLGVGFTWLVSMMINVWGEKRSEQLERRARKYADIVRKHVPNPWRSGHNQRDARVKR